MSIFEWFYLSSIARAQKAACMDDNGFTLEIHGLHEFAAFVAIIRGHDPTAEKLHELTARLTKSTEALSDAEKPYAGTTTNIPPPTT